MPTKCDKMVEVDTEGGRMAKGNKWRMASNFESVSIRKMMSLRPSPFKNCLYLY